MPASTDPIFTKNVKVSSVLITAANTSSQGGGTIGTDIFLVGTVGADGGYVRRVRFIPTATTPTTTGATVARIFISNVASGSTTSANTFLIGEITLPAIAADSASSAVFYFDFPVNDGLAGGSPGQSILVTTHAAPVANTNWRATMFYGDY